MSMGTITRIDDELRRINYFFQDSNYKMALDGLMVIHSEISPFLTDTEVKENLKIEEGLITIMARCQVRSPKTHKVELVPNRELERGLRLWDRTLRKLMLKYKLYMKMSDNRLAASKI